MAQFHICSLSLSSVLVDDGTPRIPFPLRIHLSLTVLRLKQMIEAQEGFTIGEQEVFFHGSPVILQLSSIFQNPIADVEFFPARRARQQCSNTRALSVIVTPVAAHALAIFLFVLFPFRRIPDTNVLMNHSKYVSELLIEFLMKAVLPISLFVHKRVSDLKLIKKPRFCG